MPGGSEYRGPKEALESYTKVVAEYGGNTVVKGAKNPYTSRNGHMFSFLDMDGTMALRLSRPLREDFLARYGGDPVIQYGSVMKEYVAVPSELLGNPAELGEWFDKSYTWIGTLEPKPTRR